MILLNAYEIAQRDNNMPGKDFNNADYLVAKIYLSTKLDAKEEGLFKPEFLNGDDRPPTQDMLSGDLYAIATGEFDDISMMIDMISPASKNEEIALRGTRNTALNGWCEKWLSVEAKKRLYGRVSSARNIKRKKVRSADIGRDVYTRLQQAKKHSKSTTIDAVLTALLDEYEEKNDVELWRIRLEKQA